MRHAAAYSAVVAAAGYLLTGGLTVHLLEMAGVHCRASAFRTACDFTPQAGWAPAPYVALALVALVALGLARTVWRESSPSMLVTVLGGLVLAATIYDSALRMPAIGEGKLSNDTFDTLRFAVLASLLMTAWISRSAPAPLWATTCATAASYGATMVATLAYAVLAPPYIGATRMTLLFLIYTVVGFGLHVMAVGWLTTTMRMRDAMAEAA